MIKEISFQLFGKISLEYSRKILGNYDKTLENAGIELTTEEYFSIMLFVSIIFSIITFILSFFLLNYFKIFDFYLNLMISYLLTITSGIFSFVIMYIYPSIKSISFQKELEREYMIGLLLMSSIASSMNNPYDVIEEVSKFTSLKAFSKVMRRIVKLVKYKGIDVPTAILEVSKNLESRIMRSFLLGLRVVILSGTSLYKYLHDKKETELIEYKRKLEAAGNLLSMLNEVYMIVIAFGVTLGIILGILMGSFMGDPSMKMVMMFLVGIVPIISFFYILLISLILP